MRRTCAFTVFGTPAPQGSKRAFRLPNGRINLVETSKAIEPWREDVRNAALHKREEGVEPFDGPLSMRLVFTLAKPASAPRRRRSWPSRKPDLDKLMRSTLDALTQSGLIADDARVVDVTRLAKVYPGEDEEALSSGTGVAITIATVEEAVMQVAVDAPRAARDLFA